MGVHVDGTAGTLLLADRPVLLESSSSNNRGLLVAGGDEDIVGSTVRGDGTPPRSTRGWVVRAKVLNDVVLDQGVLGPSVNGEVGVALVAVGTGVGDDPLLVSGLLLKVSGCKLTCWFQGSIPYHRPSYHHCPT